MGQLTLHSWARSGLANAISEIADGDGIPAAGLVSVAVGLEFSNRARFSRDMGLRGPGDIIGVDQAQIVRCDPSPGTRDCAPNIFPYIELADPALPWAFTPAAANPNGRLVPWLVLVVVEDMDAVSLSQLSRPPIQKLSLRERAGEILPPLREAYAWAHVASRQGDGPQPGDLIARILCPIRLSRDRAYIACLVPAFEAGRLAGLGREVDEADGRLAWESTTDALDLPVYHSWRFSTGMIDFESAVRRLRPHRADETVGLHDLDVSAPGGGLDAAELGLRAADRAAPLLSYIGALASPGAKPREWPTAHRAAFQGRLSAMLGRADRAPPSRRGYRALRDDPVVSPPVYGAPQTGVADLPTKPPRWQAEANLNPTWRAAAGLGAEVVRRHQEEFMAVAWATARNAHEVRTFLRGQRMALGVGGRMHRRLGRLGTPDILQITSPIHDVVRFDGGRTVSRALEQGSQLSSTAMSTAFRRLVANSGRRGVPMAAREGLQRGVTQICLATQPADGSQLGDSVGLGTTKSVERGGVSVSGTASLRQLAQRFGPGRNEDGTAHRKVQRGKSAPAGRSAPVEGRTALPGGDEMRARILDACRPDELLPSRVRARVPGLQEAGGRVPIPRSPLLAVEFDEPAYRRLQRLGSELLLPGFGTLPDRSVSLMSVDRRVVEAYLLGLNHEMGREFAWRQFPTRQDATWFRSFWSYRDARKDIEPISAWKPGAALGTNGAGEPEAQSVVIIKGDLFRRFPGTRVYAAKAAWAGPDEAAGIEAMDRRKGPAMDAAARTARLDEPSSVVFPDFEGRIGSAAAFFGFPLAAGDLRGDPRPARRRPGWFIVFEQPLDHPQFGLDEAREFRPKAAPRLADDLSWGHFAASAEALQTVRHATAHPAWEATAIEGARWGATSAETARLAFQNAVRVLFHAGSLVDPGQG